MSGQILLLKLELDNSPELYGTMSDIEVANSLNATAVVCNKASVSNSETLEAIDSGELLGLTGDKAVRVWGVLAIETLNPFGVSAAIMLDAFGEDSVTITALKAIREESISRAAELGYPGRVKQGHVEMARAKK